MKIKSLTDSENQHCGDKLWNNSSSYSTLIGIINLQRLSNKKCIKNNFDLKNLMQEPSFDHMGLSGTYRNWFLLQEEDRITQRFWGNFHSGDLATNPYHNTHSNTLATFQLGVTTSMYTKSLSCLKTIWEGSLGYWDIHMCYSMS